MNRVSPEMLQLHCLSPPPGPAGAGNCTDMTVLERQRARLRWQQDQLQQLSQSNNNNNNYFNGNELINGLLYNPIGSHSGQIPFPGIIGALKPDPGLENNGWPELDRFDYPGMGYGQSPVGLPIAAGNISRTSSCPPVVVPVTGDLKAPEKISSPAGRESLKKRKLTEKLNNIKVVNQEDESREKRTKGSSEEGESKITEQNSPKNHSNNNNNNNRENSGETSKENSKASEVQKPDYIHVRARRGQATDSHSLAERVRREKISERMKYLQDLVPGCNKITGKAGMLDEIINYVQSLQRQVEFLSMKLAAVNPRLDFNIDDLFAKEMFPSCTAGIQAMGISPAAEISNSAYHLQFNQAQQIASCGGLEMGLTSVDLALRRTISAPVSIPDQTFLDTSCYIQQIQPQLPAWDSELQNLFAGFPSQPFAGSVEASNLKMEM